MILDNRTTIISEIDGVITDGTSDIGELNIVISKRYNLKDFEAINMIKKHFNFVFMSSSGNINLTLCRKRNIPFFVAEANKKNTYGSILSRYSISPDNVIYVGSTYSDVDCIRMSSISFCPVDAVPAVLKSVSMVLDVKGGEGVLCHLYEYLNNKLLSEASIYE